MAVSEMERWDGGADPGGGITTPGEGRARGRLITERVDAVQAHVVGVDLLGDGETVCQGSPPLVSEGVAQISCPGDATRLTRCDGEELAVSTVSSAIDRAPGPMPSRHHDRRAS